MKFSTKTKSRLVWGLRILLALVFAFAASGKLFGTPAMIALFEQIGIGQWFRYLTGGVEILGAVLMLTPRRSFPGALLLCVTMVGAVVTHLYLVGGSAVPAIVLLALTGVLAYCLRPTGRFTAQATQAE